MQAQPPTPQNTPHSFENETDYERESRYERERRKEKEREEELRKHQEVFTLVISCLTRLGIEKSCRRDKKTTKGYST